MSSEHATQNIAPAAKPRPTDSQKINFSTKINTGTAIIGCANEDAIAITNVWKPGTPLGINTNATAKPSCRNSQKSDLSSTLNQIYERADIFQIFFTGTLCTASVMEMNVPNLVPSFPQKDTPIPSPSAKE